MPEQFTTITPTRGDRNNLLSFTLKRVLHKANYQITVLYPPVSEAIDIVPRVKKGIEMAKRNGYDFVFIVEDDDYYNEGFFNSWGDLDNLDFVGFSDTIYYNLKNRTYQTFDHEGRSSLFCTGIRISALDNFNWPNDSWPFLDVRLWEFATRYDKRISLLKGNPTLGIKGHGQGKAAGKGHTMMMKHSDNDHSFLKSRVDNEAFEFYTGLINK